MWKRENRSAGCIGSHVVCFVPCSARLLGAGLAVEPLDRRVLDGPGGAWVDGWMAGQTDGWLDGLMDGWTD